MQANYPGGRVTVHIWIVGYQTGNCNAQVFFFKHVAHGQAFTSVHDELRMER